MKKVLTGQKNLEYCVNQKLKELAKSYGLEEDMKGLSLIGLESLLSKNVKGFSLRKNFLNKSMTISWIEEGKFAEVTYSVDPESGEIYEEDNN